MLSSRGEVQLTTALSTTTYVVEPNEVMVLKVVKVVNCVDVARGTHAIVARGGEGGRRGSGGKRTTEGGTVRRRRLVKECGWY